MIINNTYHRNIEKRSDYLIIRQLRTAFQDSLNRTIATFKSSVSDYNNSRIAVDCWLEIMKGWRDWSILHIKSLTRAKKALETYIV